MARLQGMSRRSRKRRDAGGRRWLGKLFVGTLILGIIGLGVAYGMLRRYLHSDEFRKFLSVEASEMGGVTGEFGPFHWEGLAINTDSFEAKGEGLITGLPAMRPESDLSWPIFSGPVACVSMVNFCN